MNEGLLMTVGYDEDDDMYAIFSECGDREVLFTAKGLLELAAWIEEHRATLEEEARQEEIERENKI